MSGKELDMNKSVLKAVIYILAVVGVFCVAGAFAYNMHKLETENVLQSHKMEYSSDLSVDETFPERTVTPGSKKTKKVAFKNTSSAPVFIRICFSETWETSNLIIADVSGVTKNWTSAWTKDWVQKPDGWWYYSKVLPAGEETAEVLESVTFPNTVPDSADYILSFNVEAVQASDEASVNTDATLALFGRVGTISNMQVSNGAVASGDVAWN